MRERILLPAGIVLLVTGAALSLPGILGLFEADGTAWSFLGAGLGSAAAGIVAVALRPRVRRGPPPARIAGVSVGALIAVFVSTLPFLFWGAPPLDALFEAVSGWTTTGASVFPDPAALPRSLLLWRSLMQWLGGLGVLIVAGVLLPQIEPGRARLLDRKAATGRWTRPALGSMMWNLSLLYVSLTGLNGLLLFLGNVRPFEAICLALSTISTGGFTPGPLQLGLYAELVTVVFMLLGASNFIVHVRAFQEGAVEYWKSGLVRTFLGLAVFFTATSTLVLWTRRPELATGEVLRRGVFESVSFLTTSGFHYGTAFERPPFIEVLFVLITFVGGMAGSTAGGIKVQRWSAAVQEAGREIARLIHPRRVLRVRIEGIAVERTVLERFTLLLLAWILTFAAGAMVLLMCGLDLGSSLSGSAAVLNNVGEVPGGSPTFWSNLPGAAKAGMAMLMLLGRLEIFSLLVTLSPSFWRHP